MVAALLKEKSLHAQTVYSGERSCFKLGSFRKATGGNTFLDLYMLRKKENNNTKLSSLVFVCCK